MTETKNTAGKIIFVASILGAGVFTLATDKSIAKQLKNADYPFKKEKEFLGENPIGVQFRRAGMFGIYALSITGLLSIASILLTSSNKVGKGLAG